MNTHSLLNTSSLWFYCYAVNCCYDFALIISELIHLLTCNFEFRLPLLRCWKFHSTQILRLTGPNVDEVIIMFKIYSTRSLRPSVPNVDYEVIIMFKIYSTRSLCPSVPNVDYEVKIVSESCWDAEILSTSPTLSLTRPQNFLISYFENWDVTIIPNFQSTTFLHAC
jgi:hypothetical protein